MKWRYDEVEDVFDLKILIITGGKIDEEFCVDYINRHRFDKIIAVDGGLAFADKFALTDIVGDFDTIDSDIIDRYKNMPNGPAIHEYVPEKDNTDTDIALQLAIKMCQSCEENQYSEIIIVGATGTRLDHVLANITMLLSPFYAGIKTSIVDANNRIQLISGSTSILAKQQFGTYVSLIPLTPSIDGVTLRGVKYPLTNQTIKLGSSLCVSNEIVGEEALISIGSGIAILFETRD